MLTSRGGGRVKMGDQECESKMPSDSLGIFDFFHLRKNTEGFTIRFAARED